MNLTPQAKKLWEAIPQKYKLILLNNVWCSTCGDMRGIAIEKGFVEDRHLILQGTAPSVAAESVA